MEPWASSPRAVPRIVVVVVGDKVQEEQKRREEVIPAASKASRENMRILKSAVPRVPRRDPIAAPHEAVERQLVPLLLRVVAGRRSKHRR